MGGDLDTFTPVPKPVVTRDKTLQILPIRAKHLSAFGAAVAPVLPLLLEGKLQEAVTHHSTGLIEAAAIGSGQPADWVGELYPDDFLRLVGVVVEVNADFFAHRVLPATHEAAKAITAAIRGAIRTSPGGTSSPGSPSGEATGSPTASS